MRSGLLCVLVLCLSACPPRVTRDRAAELAASLDENSQVLRDFTRWDDQHQVEIVQKAPSLQVGQERLRRYREIRDHVRALLKQQALSLDLAIRMLAEQPRIMDPAPVPGGLP